MFRSLTDEEAKKKVKRRRKRRKEKAEKARSGGGGEEPEPEEGEEATAADEMAPLAAYYGKFKLRSFAFRGSGERPFHLVQVIDLRLKIHPFLRCCNTGQLSQWRLRFCHMHHTL